MRSGPSSGAQTGAGWSSAAWLDESLPVAAAALASGQIDAADRLYTALSEHAPDAPAPWMGRGYVALAFGDPDQAHELFVRAAHRAHGAVRAEAWVGAGRAALMLGRWSAARSAFHAAASAVEAGSWAADAANGLGLLEARAGHWSGALKAFERAEVLRPDRARFRANRVRALLALGRYADAEAAFLDPTVPYDWSDATRRALRAALDAALPAGPEPIVAFRVLPDMRLALPDADVSVAWPTPAPAAAEPRVVAIGHESGSDGDVEVVLGRSLQVPVDREIDSVLTARSEVADIQVLSPRALYVVGRAPGTTSVAVVDHTGAATDFVVRVVPDAAVVEDAFSGVPGLAAVSVSAVGPIVLLEGEVASAEDAAHARRLASGILGPEIVVEDAMRITAGQQVRLEVQIAEVSRSVTEALGVRWEAFGVDAANRFGLRIGQLPTVPDAVEGLRPDAFPSSHLRDRLAPTAFAGTSGTRGWFRLMIDALSSAGLANVLARPNVTAVSGEKATFFAGGKFPVASGYDPVKGVVTFTYEKVGVALDFVPVVVGPDRLVLTVSPQVSEPVGVDAVALAQGVTMQVISSREASTTVEVADGDSLVIAGLFRNHADRTSVGVPGLKDLPLLGVLFGTDTSDAQSLELIVVVTAHLVSSAPASVADAAPTDDVLSTPAIDGLVF